MGPRNRSARFVRAQFAFCALLAATMLASTSLSAGELDLILEEDFEEGLPASMTAIGTTQVIDDGSGDNLVLMLTTDGGNQGGWAWFADEFDLSDQRVEIEFDLFLGRGATAVPADGMAVIFQFDSDLEAIGNVGGDLGVGNLRGAGGSYEYVAMGFDIWDNGAADPETPCDGRHGAQSTSRARVYKNEASPHQAAGLANGPLPDMISSAAIYGSPSAANNTGAESFDPEDLVHIKIVFDFGFMEVTVSGGVDCSDGISPFEEQVVISTLTGAIPDRPSNIGFSAATGGANAFQWIDNLVVREGDSNVTLVSEDPRTEGAINCADEAVDTAGELDILFERDRPKGAESNRVGDLETGLTITLSQFGRVGRGADFTNTNARPIDVSDLPGAGTETAKIFANDAWSTVGVEYGADVIPGRYEASLYWSENFSGAINSVGQGTRLYDVYVGDERVLCNWSAAAAAGTGSGDPSAACAGVLDTAVRRTFAFDVADRGDGVGDLSIVVDDLGGGNPPENAALNALSFRRLGDASGEAANGDLECITKDPGDEPPGAIVDSDFEDDDEFECPVGWVCNSNNFLPQVIAGRLRVTEDATGSTGASVIYEETVNVCDYKLSAEFDIFMSNPDGLDDPAAAGLEAADGAAFFVMQGNNTSALGGGGGSLGLPTGAFGFAVEFDTWNNGGGVNDPSGFNDATNRYTHVGINNMSIASVQTNVQYNPDFKPVAAGGTGWPNFFDPDGVHVLVEYDAGLVTVTIEGITAEGDGFGPEVVCEASVPPILTTEAVLGFCGGTGGRTQDTEIDDLEVLAGEGETDGSDPTAQAMEDALERWNDSQGELYINCGGPLLACSASQFPAPGATGEDNTGEPVVWLSDLTGGGSLELAESDFFTVTPLDNRNFSNTGLQVANTNMGLWDARGTDPGIDDNDRVFHSERWADHQYDIPVDNGEYEVTLYFANSFSGTSGTARRFFHVVLEDDEQSGFEHCPTVAPGAFGGTPNPLFEIDNLYDPVGHAEMLYSPDPCNFAPCENNGVTVTDDPDGDAIRAGEECGNAAAAALRYTVEVEDGMLSIAVTEPDTAGGEPLSPDMNPKISGIAVKRSGVAPSGFVRGDSNSSGIIDLTDGVVTLSFLFTGGPAPACMDAADTDNNGGLVISDAVITFSYLFTGGPPPQPPSPSATSYPPGDCGPDSDASLGCVTLADKCQ